MSPADLFGMGPQTHKTAAREKLLEQPVGTSFLCEGAYRLCRGLPNPPMNWKENVRDELYRLRNDGYFADHKNKDGDAVYTRTDRN